MVKGAMPLPTEEVYLKEDHVDMKETGTDRGRRSADIEKEAVYE